VRLYIQAQAAIREMYGAAAAVLLRAAGPAQRLLLAALLVEARAANRPDVTLGVRAACDAHSPRAPTTAGRRPRGLPGRRGHAPTTRTRPCRALPPPYAPT
jgi:hypothetical protein